METENIKKTGSYDPETTTALIGLGYESKETVVKRRDGSSSKKIVITLGDAPCRTFENLADVQANLSDKLIVQYCTEKCHVLDKQAFEDKILAEHGLKKVSATLTENVEKTARGVWAMLTGQKNDESLNLEGTAKVADGKVTFKDVREKTLAAVTEK